MSISAFIIEDENPARQTLKSYLARYFPNVIVAAESDTISDSIYQLSVKRVDIIFLDVQLKDGLGVEVLKALGENLPRVIFITAYEDYTQEAFKHKAFGYLLKPLDPQDFKDIMNRVIKDICYEPPTSQSIKIPFKDGRIVLDVNSIVRCEAESNYTKITTEVGKTFIISKTLKFVEEELISDSRFIRPHQSHLINIDYLNKNILVINTLTLMNGDKIPVSRSRKERVSAILSKAGVQFF